jgi:hypothetical protein
VQEKAAGCRRHTDGGAHEPKVPECLAARQQSDRRDDQADLEEDLAQIEAVGAGGGGFNLVFQFFGVSLDFFEFVAVALGLSGVLFLEFRGRLCVLGLDQRECRGEHLVSMQAIVLCLIVSPLVRSLRVQQPFFRVGTVPEQGSDRDQHRQDGHGQSCRRQARVTVSVFGVFVHFVKLFRHGVSS